MRAGAGVHTFGVRAARDTDIVLLTGIAIPAVHNAAAAAMLQTPAQQSLFCAQMSAPCPHHDEGWHVPAAQRLEQQSVSCMHALPSVRQARGVAALGNTGHECSTRANPPCREKVEQGRGARSGRDGGEAGPAARPAGDEHLATGRLEGRYSPTDL